MIQMTDQEMGSIQYLKKEKICQMEGSNVKMLYRPRLCEEVARCVKYSCCVGRFRVRSVGPLPPVTFC